MKLKKPPAKLQILGSSGKTLKRFEKIGECVLATLQKHSPNSILITLSYLDIHEMADLNQKALSHKGPATVISIPSHIQNEKNLFIGDIYICKEEAKNQGFLNEELFIHGLLHLSGFDHKQASAAWDKIEMKAKACILPFGF